MKCDNGHQLVEHRGRVDGYQGGGECDLCRQNNLCNFTQFYRCGLCKFDICTACVLH